MSDSRDQIDDAVAHARRVRGPFVAALLVSLPLGGVALSWALDKPSDARGLIAAFAGTTILLLAIGVGLSTTGPDPTSPKSDASAAAIG